MFVQSLPQKADVVINELLRYFAYLAVFGLVGCHLWGRTELDTTEVT